MMVLESLILLDMLYYFAKTHCDVERILLKYIRFPGIFIYINDGATLS